MFRRKLRSYAVAFVVLATAIGPLFARPATNEELARRIMDETAVAGGLVVHLGCDDGQLTAALRVNDAYLVHGLDKDAEDVAQARRTVRSCGSYGPVSIRQWRPAALPYADEIVNLLVVEQTPTPPRTELLRVLVPNGVAYIREADRWRKIVKPRPHTMDEWTHFLHDASNNAVANDSLVGPPRRLQWVCGPEWARSHEFTSSLCAMVSAHGRVFYIFDEGLTGVTPKSLPERWTLIARDAFNGLQLWRRPVPKWGSQQWNSRALRSIPGTVPRRLVGQGDRLFVTLGYHAPVSVLDAATGRTLHTWEDTAGAEELRCCDGILILRRQRNTVLALDAESGKKLWQAAGKIQPFSLAVHDGRVLYQDGQKILCKRLTDGQPIWQIEHQAPLSLLLVGDDVVVLLGRKTMQAVALNTGRTLWTVTDVVQRRELFIARGRLWHWQEGRVVGRDLKSGRLTARPDTEDVFTPGHHLRCYQSKATENFLITPNRGAEFVSLTGGEHTQNDWARGPCGYGIMPCNGLLYLPPHPCFCYPGVKLTGFNALAPVAAGNKVLPRIPATKRLEQGPAYGRTETSPHSAPSAKDWPTYRHDPRRSGATACEVSPELSMRWDVQLQGEITPPVVADRRVFVAVKDKHAVHAFRTKDGRELWSFTAGGRIDSPPTVHGGLLLFGCTDGSVYCLRASDGALVWRFRAAPSERFIIADGQLESPWPVHGSILLRRGVAYCTAGRSSYLDGGIFLFALDSETGKLLHQARIDDWARTRADAEDKPFIAGYHMEGARSDILVSQGDAIYLGQTKFDLNLVRQEVPYVMPDAGDKTTSLDLSHEPYVVPDAEPEKDYEKHQRDWLERTQEHLLKTLRQKYGAYSLGQRKMGLHVLATSGFLDDSWYNRTYWMYSSAWPGYYLAHRAAKTGQLLVVGPEKTYAVQAYPSRNLQSPLFTPGRQGYLLLVDNNENEPVLDHRTRGTTKGWGFTRREPPAWHRWVPLRVRAMVLAGSQLFVAGPPDVVDPADPMAAFEGRKGGLLWAISPADGTKRSTCALEAPPVFDGIIAARDRLFASLQGGKLLCLGGRAARITD